MPLVDQTNLLLADDTDVTADANGSDVAVQGLNKGQICMAIMHIEGAIDSSSGDEVMDVYIEEKIGTAYYNIGVFPRISYDTATEYVNADFASAGRVARCFFVINPDATHIRCRFDVTGTTVSYADVSIVVVPTNAAPPM